MGSAEIKRAHISDCILQPMCAVIKHVSLSGHTDSCACTVYLFINLFIVERKAGSAIKQHLDGILLAR